MARLTRLASTGTAGRIERGKYTFPATAPPSTMAVAPADRDWVR